MATPEPDLSARDDGELMTIIAERASDPARAKIAWAELYKRHADVLKHACREYGRRMPADYGTVDLVADTFIEAYAGAHTYRRPNARASSVPYRSRRSVLGRLKGGN